MRTLATRLVLLLTVLMAGAASALRPPQDYHAGEEQTPEEVAAAKSRNRDAVPAYGAQVDTPPEPFPWMAVGLGVIALVCAAPFALRYYGSLTQEINGTKTPRTSRRSRNELDA